MIYEDDADLTGEIRVDAPPEAAPALSSTSDSSPPSEAAAAPAPPPPPLKPEELLAAQFKGKKAELKPLYDAIVHIARRLHPKVRVEPLPNAVRFVARRPFAVFKATTAERVDLGLSLGDLEPRGRLRACKALAGVEGITHRIEVFGPSDLNAELVRYMKLALEAPPPKAKTPAAPARVAAEAVSRPATEPAKKSPPAAMPGAAGGGRKSPPAEVPGPAATASLPSPGRVSRPKRRAAADAGGRAKTPAPLR